MSKSKSNGILNNYLKNRKTQKGITLTVLVITIIVILILVGVSVTVAIKGGLFEKAKEAKEAKEKTEAAKEAEQVLSDGRVQVDGKWYKSYQDYLDGKEAIIGIIIPEEITLEIPEENYDVEASSVTAEITANLNLIEGKITWESTDKEESVIKLEQVEEKENIRKITAIGKGKATITVTCGEYTAECEVKVKNLTKIERGAFVEYGVAYKDAYYPTYNYTTANGWRLLDYTYNEETDSYTNVKLISTGIPAKLYYYYNDITNSSWYVTNEDVGENEAEDAPSLNNFRTILGGNNYTFYTGSNTYYALRAAAGMYYNFGDIKFAYFKPTDSATDRGRSLGFFESITVHNGANSTTYTKPEEGETAEEKTGNELFKVRDDASVRLLTLPELNELLGITDIDSTTEVSSTEEETAKGLYRLDQLKNVEGMGSYTYSGAGGYWLASPIPDTRYGGHVCYVYDDGSVDYGYNDTRGIRTVVYLSSEIQFTDLNGDGALEIAEAQQQ